MSPLLEYRVARCHLFQNLLDGFLVSVHILCIRHSLPNIPRLLSVDFDAIIFFELLDHLVLPNLLVSVLGVHFDGASFGFFLSLLLPLKHPESLKVSRFSSGVIFHFVSECLKFELALDLHDFGNRVHFLLLDIKRFHVWVLVLVLIIAIQDPV